MLIHAPLANRLGIWQLKWELEDLAFRYQEPEQYRKIANLVAEHRTEREALYRRFMDRLSERWRRPASRRSEGPPQAHLQHLEKNAAQGAGFSPAV